MPRRLYSATRAQGKTRPTKQNGPSRVVPRDEPESFPEPPVTRKRAMTTKFYGKAETAAKAILDAFQNPSELPKALAPMFIKRKDNVPCQAWSWSNQLISALRGRSTRT